MSDISTHPRLLALIVISGIRAECGKEQDINPNFYMELGHRNNVLNICDRLEKVCRSDREDVIPLALREIATIRLECGREDDINPHFRTMLNYRRQILNRLDIIEKVLRSN